MYISQHVVQKLGKIETWHLSFHYFTGEGTLRAGLSTTK